MGKRGEGGGENETRKFVRTNMCAVYLRTDMKGRGGEVMAAVGPAQMTWGGASLGRDWEPGGRGAPKPPRQAKGFFCGCASVCSGGAGAAAQAARGRLRCLLVVLREEAACPVHPC